MKKILALTSLIFALSVGATAMASDAQSVPNDPSGVDYTTENASGYATVLVQGPGEATDIVYVDQHDSAFGTGLNLMLKPNLTPGTYTIKFGGAGKETTTQEFTLTTDSGSTTPTGEPMARGLSDSTGTVYEATVNGSYDKVQFVITEKATGNKKKAELGLDVPVVSGMYQQVIVLVTGIPDTVTVDVTLLPTATQN